MNRDMIENEIEQLLSNFSGQFTRAKNYKSIPKIEMDLMMSTVRDLYEQLYRLSCYTLLPENKVLTESKAVVAQIPVVEEKNAHAEVITHALMSENEPVQIAPGIIVQELKQVETKTTHQDEQEEVQVTTSIRRESVFTEHTKVQPKPVGSLFDEVPTIAANYKEQQSLHHKIGNTKTERLSDKLQQQPVMDLKRSIGINEKFAFINELFGGNQQQYNQCIETLNSFSNHDEALAHLNELSANMKWNTSSKTFHELDEMVIRRFGM